MVWIRRVRTASGATAVQIAESVDGRRRIVRHVGSARDDAELGLLIEEARRLLADGTQNELDLGITPKAVRAHMVRPPDQALFTDEPLPRQLVVRPQVLKSSSALLYEALAGVYASLGFDAVGDEVFRDLVIARVVEPTSLLDVDRVLAELGRTSASLSTRKRTLRRACGGGYRDQIAAACFAHARTAGDVSLVLYDVTTLYFEADKEDQLRRVGYSKERRVDPQIVVGLLVDRRGFPLEIGCFEGNKAETLTIVPIVKAFQARHEITDMVVVADAGMLASGNLRELDEAGLRFIVGPRVTKAPNDLASRFHWHGELSLTARSSTPSPHVITAAPRRKPVTSSARLSPSGIRPSIPSRGARCGHIRPTARCATPRRSICRRTRPARSSLARRPRGHRGSSRTATVPKKSTKPLCSGRGAWSGSRATSPTSTLHACPRPK